MKTVTLEVRSLKDSLKDMAKAMSSGKASDERIAFDTPQLLLNTLTSRRWEIIKTLLGAGPIGIRELARRVDRDVKGVHSDTKALVECGLLLKYEGGKVEFPYDAVHVDFMLKAA